MDPSDFDYWKTLPITQYIYKKIAVLDEQLKDIMLNPNIMLEEGGQVKYARAAGSRDIIYSFLTLEFEDLEIEKEEIDDDGNEENR